MKSPCQHLPRRALAPGRFVSGRSGSIILKTLVILIVAAAVFGSAAYFAYTLFVKPQRALKAETAFGTPTPAPDQTIPEYERILGIKQSNDLLGARAAYEHFLESYPASTKLEAARDDLGEINVSLYFSSSPSPDKVAYTIKHGDSLAAIERKLKAPGDLIMRSNNISDPRKLRIGDTLYVPHPEFSLVIDRKTHLVTLYNKARYFKQYHPAGWTAPTAKTVAPLAGKVTEIINTHNGQRVSFGSRDYEASTHSIRISVTGFSLYTDPAEGGEKASGAGVILGNSDMGELSALLTHGVPVTIH